MRIVPEFLLSKGDEESRSVENRVAGRCVVKHMSPAVKTSIDESFVPAGGRSPLPASIFDEFAVAVWAVAMQALGDEKRADEVVEATFTTFARSPGSLAGSDDPGLLLFATVRRITLDRLVGRATEAIDAAPPVAVSRQRWRSALALGRMTGLELATTRLRHEHGLRPDAIAFQLGQPVEVVARCTERADELLGDQLAVDGGLFEALRPPDPRLRERLVEQTATVRTGAGVAAAGRVRPAHVDPSADTSELPAGGR